MTVQDYQITTTGDRHLTHNGLTVHAGRKVVLDSTATATKAALAAGFITTTVTATAYEGDASYLTTYTVQAAGNGHVLHNGTKLTTGQTLQLEASDDTAKRLLAIGYIA